MLLVVLAALVGFLVGSVLVAFYLRREVAAEIAPRLEHIEQLLRTLQNEVHLDAATRLAALSSELSRRAGSPVAPASPPGPEFDDDDDDDE